MTHINLIESEWIPVRRLDGQSDRIAPWQLTLAMEDNPIVAVDFPRADLSSAIVMFLIGLCQAAITPASAREWDKHYQHPPAPEWLREHMGALQGYFNVGGDGARCFQDADLHDADPRPIASLFIEEPGGQTVRQNRDLFIKREQYPLLGLSAAMAVVINMQNSAPSGGQGHRTSMRGGGPLNTLLIPDPVNDDLPSNLWRIVWLNVLNADEKASLSGHQGLVQAEASYPWLAATRTSQPKTGCDTTPQDVHPLQMYFATPRRISLDLDDLETGHCPLTNFKEPLLRAYRTKNYGVNYAGAWEHPFSPHRLDEQGMPLPLHPQPGGIGYRHWLHLTMGSGDGVGKDSIRSAKVVTAGDGPYKRGRRKLVWAFGYDMDNMKARAWYESTMPIYHLDELQNEMLAYRANNMIETAKEIGGNLRQAVRNAWLGERTSVSGDISFILLHYWQRTESLFFKLVHQEYLHLRGELPKPDRQQWHSSLHAEAINLFDLHAASGDLAFENPKRIAVARRNLIKFNHKNTILERLGISSRAA